MAGNTLNPAKTSASRVFLIEGRARPDHAPSYQSCMRGTGVDMGLGDSEPIKCPDPYNYNEFIEIGTIKGAKERGTTSLEGRYALDTKSKMMELARKGCAIDVQQHFGECSDPSVFNKFKKAVIFEDVQMSNYGTGDLGALSEGDAASIDETLDISAKDIYEVLPVSYALRAGSIVTVEVLDVVICDRVGCGECEDESDGCKKIFAITTSAGGSPGTPSDILFSLDKGSIWYAHDIDTLGVAEAARAVDCLGDNVVVVSNASNSLHYALKSEMDGVTDPVWTEVTTGFVAGGEPNNIWSTGNYAFIVGDWGYIYGTDDPTQGVDVLDAGVALGPTDNLLAVHGLSDQFAVAVGDSGAVAYTTNRINWSATNRPVGVGVNLNTVWVKSETEWWVGSSAGRLYYTLNGGTTWTEKAFAGSGAGVVRDIVFSTPSIGWLAHSTAAPRGRILRTYDGGYSWQLTPEDSGSMPLSDRVTRLAACSLDPNFVVGVGLADDAADGVIVVGEAI